MKYQSLDIKAVMQMISQNEIYLPAIQRKFIWEPEKIVKLFDSIMRGYPIGTFLLWFVDGESKDKYTFYKFIQNYHERDRCWNEVAPRPELRESIIGVLDGQQRLNSMYVALQGSYSFKRPKARWKDDGAFPRRELYINLLFNPGAEAEDDLEFEFALLPEAEARAVDAGHCWFLVKTAISWADTTPVFACIQNLQRHHSGFQREFEQRGARILMLLWQRLCSDEVVNYFPVKEQDLDRVVDIFVRVNSTGQPLSKTDLLFSSIVAHWEQGRTEIETLIKTLNNKGSRFNFDNDFVMRCCLVLSDLPVLFKVESFKKDNIDTIKCEWKRIAGALEVAVDLLVEWGFNSETLPAHNAVVPIVYYLYKGGDVRVGNNVWHKYLVRALLNQIYSSQTDRVISALRDQMRSVTQQSPSQYEFTGHSITLDRLLAAKFPGDKSLAITEEDIERFLEYEKGPYSFMVLSLLYPQLRFDEVHFHQDHIHPRSGFSQQNLHQNGVSGEIAIEWQANRDKLPNLQLMEGRENESKRATPFDEWLEKNIEDKSHFLRSNHCPVGVELSLKEFGSFYDARRELLRGKLRLVLTV